MKSFNFWLQCGLIATRLAIAHGRGAFVHADEFEDCTSECTLDEMNRFWSDCCCISCENGIYLRLPDGISADDSLPWWTCCDVLNSYILFLCSSIFMLSFYVNFCFWYKGYAIFPTSIVRLSKTSNYSAIQNQEGKEEEDQLYQGPKTVLTDMRIVRHASLHSKASQYGEQQQEQQLAQSFVNLEYFATIEVLTQGNNGVQPITIALKSYAAYKQLQDYCQVRGERCWESKTTDPLHPYYGYQLITMGAGSNELLLYQPYFYHARWKFQSMAFGILCALVTLLFLTAAPTLHSFWIVVCTNAIALLLASLGFALYGHHGKGGIYTLPEYHTRDSIYSLIPMHDNPGLRPVV